MDNEGKIMGLTTNLIMSILILNVLLVYAYPIAFGETSSTQLLGRLNSFGSNFSYNNVTHEITAVANVTGNVTETTDIGDMFGLTEEGFAGFSGIFYIPSIIAGFIGWLFSFFYAPYVVVSHMPTTTPSIIPIMILVIYTGLYIMAVLEIVLGRR
jgi:hypothetical protein